MYRQRDVELVVRIKRLLYDQGFTIPGAREQLKAEAKPSKAQFALPLADTKPKDELKRVRQGLRDLLALLNAPVGGKRSRVKPTASATRAS